jgi:hypothetical protein
MSILFVQKIKHALAITDYKYGVRKISFSDAGWYRTMSML